MFDVVELGTQILSGGVELAREFLFQVTNSGSDRAQLGPLAKAARDAMGKTRLRAVADRGYYSGPQIKECADAGALAERRRRCLAFNGNNGLALHHAGLRVEGTHGGTHGPNVIRCGAAATTHDIHAEVTGEVDHLIGESFRRLVVMHLAFDDRRQAGVRQH